MTQEALTDSLEELRAKHHAVARYTIALVQRDKKVVLFQNLPYDVADPLHEQLRKEHESALPCVSFTTPVHGIELENPRECLSQEARDRLDMVGGRRLRGPRVRRLQNYTSDPA